MKVELENVKPMEIEKRSFEIITEELGDKQLVPGTELIVKRCIHTSADFDYAENLCFSEGVVQRALEAIKAGACIVTDTQMAKAGINKRALARYGGEVYCFMSDEDVAKIAKEYDKPVIAFSGCVTKDAIACNEHGIDAFFPVLRSVSTLDEAMCRTNAMQNIEDTAEQVFRLIRTFSH